MNPELYFDKLDCYEIASPNFEGIERKRVDVAHRFAEKDGIYSNPASTQIGKANILLVGDLMGEPKMQRAAFFDDKFNFRDSFDYVKNIIRSSDLAIGNLETTICTTAPYAMDKHHINKKYHCNSPPEYLDALRYAGFDALVLANNHNLDCGVRGVEETLYHVDKYRFGHTGLFLSEKTKRYVLFNVNGILLAVLSYSEWFNRNEKNLTKQGQNTILNKYDIQRIKTDILEAKNDGAEFVLVYMHWGTDSDYKYKSSSSQKEKAQKIADAGADYIVGSHPHAIQEYEVIVTTDGKIVPVAYSLGNFHTSDMNHIARDNIILSFTLERSKGGISIVHEQYIPCHVFNHFGGKSYPIIPAIKELNGNIDNQKLDKAYALAMEIFSDKIHCYRKPL